jgi:hypothetical protein
MINLIKLVTFLLGTFYVFKIIKELYVGKNYNTVVYPAIVFYVFMYIPIICDILIGRPEYNAFYYGFILSGNDPLTEIIYCISITYIMYIFRRFQTKYIFLPKTTGKNYATTTFFVVFFVLNLLLLPILTNTELMNVLIRYEMFQYKQGPFSAIKPFGLIIIALILFVLFLEKKRKIFFVKLCLLIPYIYLALSMSGKRAVFFIFFAGLIYILISNKFIIRGQIFLFVVPIIALLFFFSSQYQQHFDRIHDDSFASKYTNFRIDYGRDDTFKMVVFSEIHKEANISILKSRGQSLLFYPTFFIKRDVWTEKPYPYAVYFTSAMLGISDPSFIGWGMTTSIFDELISNLGLFLGLLVSPFMLIFVCKIGMKNNKGMLGSVIYVSSVLISILMITLQIATILRIVLMLIAALMIYKLKKRNYRIKLN